MTWLTSPPLQRAPDRSRGNARIVRQSSLDLSGHIVGEHLIANVHEIGPGIVYKDKNVTVKAFDAHHGQLAQTFGFQFDTPDRTIVISGDASAQSDVLANCQGCDVLIHEVYTEASFALVSLEWKKYRCYCDFAYSAFASVGMLWSVSFQNPERGHCGKPMRLSRSM
jgi:hypothetical protein